MPIACTNCVRFHYGPCREAPKQCRLCGGWYHIDRYCPNKGRCIYKVPGEPLAGTKEWCEMHGLNDDQELKFKILQALKTSPGTPIHINGTCIYRGNNISFSAYRDEPIRRRTTAEGINQRSARSLSPARDRGRKRSLSRGRRGRSPSPLNRGPSAHQARYRSRSPPRQRQRTPSPHRQTQYRARSPRYEANSNAVVFEARDRYAEKRRPDNRTQREAGRLTPVRFNMPPPHNGPRSNIPRSGPPPFNAPLGRAPLGQVSSNLPRSDQKVFDAPKQSSPPEPFVDDPYFVLGINENASEAVILDAFQKQIYEIDLERLAEGGGVIRGDSIWNESIQILNTAKKQLLGY